MGGYNAAIVDAFIESDAKGGPAVVYEPGGVLSETAMAEISAEVNQPETAYLGKLGEGNWQIRWFTPTLEVELCGHATLAAAHWLWESGREDRTEITLTARSTEISASRLGRDRVQIGLPSAPLLRHDAPENLGRCFTNLSYQYIGRTTEESELERDLLILVSPEDLRGIEPDFAEIESLPVGGVVVTSKSDSHEYDFMSRYFGPACGIPEDNVTGSAHCSLINYWAPTLGKHRLRAVQLSRRRGVLDVEIVGDTVFLSGRSRVVADINFR
jgi:predicted PhzF superfamily epimerase YddE/YHI9